MAESIRVAVIQLSAGSDKAENVNRANALVVSAAKRGAKFILLPEVFNLRVAINSVVDLEKAVEAVPGFSTEFLFETAKKYRAYILAGSILERASESKAFNTSALISPQGKVAARYRKQNLFNARVSGRTIEESRFILGGKRNVMADVFGFKVGMSICYDLRFPLMYERYSRRGADIICVPSSFTTKTGSAHWEVLLRSRAIENQCYVLAPNQAGADGKGVSTYGHSMIVDPWGSILKKADCEREKTLFATLTKKNIKNYSKILPSIRN